MSRRLSRYLLYIIYGERRGIHIYIYIAYRKYSKGDRHVCIDPRAYLGENGIEGELGLQLFPRRLGYRGQRRWRLGHFLQQKKNIELHEYTRILLSESTFLFIHSFIHSSIHPFIHAVLCKTPTLYIYAFFS